MTVLDATEGVSHRSVSDFRLLEFVSRIAMFRIADEELSQSLLTHRHRCSTARFGCLPISFAESSWLMTYLFDCRSAVIRPL